MDPIQNQAPVATNSKKGKIIGAIVVIAIIVGTAYYFSTKSASAPTTDISEQTLPALSNSDDVASLKADLGSTDIATTDLSSFDAELNAQ
ncbi:MAG: hypothetical protein WC763_03625 [Candidatus Paceibacterota bacterium]|jgi:hypothetical protein